MLNFPSYYTRREYLWTAWKAAKASRGFIMQYDEDVEKYLIYGYDGPEVHICYVYKGTLSEDLAAFYSQVQNDADKVDFETNFKPTGNQALSQIDTDNAQIVRIKAAKRGWSFWALPIELTTSTISGTTYAKDAGGTDITGIICRIYDENNGEITTPGLLNANLSTCVKTVLDFEPTFDYEMIGGELRINNNPASDIRLWIIGAPDIPAIYGGSKEFASGVNLKFMAPDASFEIDGRVTKYVTYNAITHQGKLRLILKHAAGMSVNIQFVIHMYKL